MVRKYMLLRTVCSSFSFTLAHDNSTDHQSLGNAYFTFTIFSIKINGWSHARTTDENKGPGRRVSYIHIYFKSRTLRAQRYCSHVHLFNHRSRM